VNIQFLMCLVGPKSKLASTNAGFTNKPSCAWYGCLWQSFLVGCYHSNRNFQLVYNMNEYVMNLFCKIGGTQSVSLPLEAKVVSFCMTHFLSPFVFFGVSAFQRWWNYFWNLWDGEKFSRDFSWKWWVKTKVPMDFATVLYFKWKVWCEYYYSILPLLLGESLQGGQNYANTTPKRLKLFF
jgi:hypothetical protein